VRRPLAVAVACAVLVVGVAATVYWFWVPSIAAGGLLHPQRRRVQRPMPAMCANETIEGAGVRLAAWRCRARRTARGTIVYLHGVADNRGSAAGWIDRLTARGYDVVAYDSRAHGDSEGDDCTYGFFEKQDLARVLDTVGAGPIVLVGTSLGASVALQEAAIDPRVSAVVAAEAFSDLRTVSTERAPRLLTPAVIRRAFVEAEREAHFQVDAVSPVSAAGHITVPVLLIHGERDVDTPPAHSQRIFAALPGPKRLILVPGVGHNASMTPEIQRAVLEWIDYIPRHA